MATERCVEPCYAVINNIPDFYHSVDLRNFFSQSVESGHFQCFHFRHRPEKQTSEREDNSGPGETSFQNVNKSESSKTTCCIIRLSRHNFFYLCQNYNNKNWLDKNGDILSTTCHMSQIKFPTENEKDNQKEVEYKTKVEVKNIPDDRVKVTESDLLKLPELHPPQLMPKGNIGTPTKTFLQYIQECRLPQKIIQKLGLNFPRTKPKKLFEAVPLDYDQISSTSTQHETLHQDFFCDLCKPSNNMNKSNKLKSQLKLLANSKGTAMSMSGSKNNDSCNNSERVTSPYSETLNHNNHSNEVIVPDFQKKRAAKKAEKRRIREMKAERIEEQMIHKNSESEEDDDGCEEWERHEAHYDDPSTQARNKERLFEEKIELKWEKGGSGLVFYTDAQYWKKFEGDFDEQCADDWDVDMSCYYEEGGGDKDSKDLVTMRQEKRRRKGIEATDRSTVGRFQNKISQGAQSNNKIGQFEKHTKGFGRKIMQKHGWSDGSKLGSSSSTGLVEALENDGQNPKNKMGFGYHGEKLQRFQPSVRKIPKIEKNEHLITTIYDNPEVTDPAEPLLRRNEPYIIKHRTGVSHIEFHKGTDS